MLAIRAKFDGRQVVLPDGLPDVAPGDVIVVFEEPAARAEARDWIAAQQTTFAQAWDNDEDAVYDTM